MTGKKHSGLMRSSRKQNWFALIIPELEEVGAEWDLQAPAGRGHPKLVATYLGQEFKSPVPSSERPGGCHKYLLARVRRFIREAQEANP